MTGTIITVRGYHLDGYRHVNNARYLEFLEEARWNLFDECKLTEEFIKRKMGMVMANINITYKRPLTFGNILEIKSRVLEYDKRRGIMEQKMYYLNSDKIVSEALINFVFVDLTTGRSFDIDDDLFSKFEVLK